MATIVGWHCGCPASNSDTPSLFDKKAQKCVAQDKCTPKAAPKQAVCGTDEKQGTCAGGQQCSYGSHAACEEGTCDYPTAACMAVTTGWHCSCPATNGNTPSLFDKKAQKCVAQDKCTPKAVSKQAVCGTDEKQ